MHPQSIGDGQLPIDERNSVEQFEAEVVPAYHAFITTLAQRSGVDPTLAEHSALSGFHERYASVSLPMIVIPTHLSCDLIVEIGEQYFPSVGYTLDYNNDDGEKCDAAWSNKEHGGLISIGSSVHTSSYGFSGHRPLTTPRTTDTYQPPAWEGQLPWAETSPHNPQSDTPPSE